MNARWIAFFFSLTVAVSSHTATSRVLTELEHERVRYAIGQLEYREHEVIYAQVAGTISSVQANPSGITRNGKPILTLKPSDPTIPEKTEFNNAGKDLIVTKLMVKKGDFVEKHQPLAVLASKDTLQARANIMPGNSVQLFIGKQVRVNINPGNGWHELPGKIIAIHNQEGILPVFETEIQLDKSQCLNSPICQKGLVAGGLIQVAI